MPDYEENTIDNFLDNADFGLPDTDFTLNELNEEHQRRNQDLCTQKKGGTWPNIPPFNGGPYPTRTWSRFVPPCPNYNLFTKQQIDMRRKAEVLKHKNNYGNVTKKKRYAYLARTNNNVTFGSPDHTNANCLKSTRDSDVPGPAMDLFLDENVPIFGLNTVRNYGNSGSKDNKLVKLPTSIHNIEGINHNARLNHISLKNMVFT